MSVIFCDQKSVVYSDKALNKPFTMVLNSWPIYFLAAFLCIEHNKFCHIISFSYAIKHNFRHLAISPKKTTYFPFIW